jgi:hypothetical protein
MLSFSLQKYTIHSHAQASFYCDRIYERKHKELKKPFLFVSDFWVFATDRTTALLPKCYCGVLFLQSHSTFIVAEFFIAFLLSFSLQNRPFIHMNKLHFIVTKKMKDKKRKMRK